MGNAIPKAFSPTGLNTYLKCGVMWKYRYLYNLKIQPAGAMIRGRGLDEAANTHYKGVARDNVGLQHDEFVEFAAGIHDEQIGQVANMDMPIGQSKDLLVLASSAYYNKIAVTLQPRSFADVQRRVETTVEGVPVLGYIDLVTTGPMGDTIIDTKLKNRMPSQKSVDDSIQLTSYSKFIGVERVGLAVAKPNGETKIITSVKTEQDVKRIGNFYRAAWDLIHKGIAVPANPSTDWWCSKKWCGYWEICPFGSGGRVGVTDSPFITTLMPMAQPPPLVETIVEDDLMDYE